MRSNRIFILLVLLTLVGCRPAAAPPPVESEPTAAETPTPESPVQLCPEGQSPAFDYGFAALKARLGDAMGTALSCERPGPLGDTVQQTSTGFARYNKATNTPTFTRGSDHWALITRGLVHWSGPALDPPDDAERLDPLDWTTAAGVPVSAKAAAVTLRLSFVRDEVRTYASTTHLTFDSSLLSKAVPPMELDALYTYRTLDVQADQSATVLATIDHVNIWAAGKNTPVPELDKLGVRVQLAPDGSYSAAEVQRDGQPFAGADPTGVAESMVLFPYPHSELHVGDAFERELPLYLGPAFPKMAIHTTYHFVGLGSINAVGVAQLEETENVAIGDWPPQNGVVLSSGQATGHGWDYISLKDGWPLTGHATLTMSFTASKSAAGTKPAPATKRDLPASGTFTVHAETTYHLQP